MLDLAVVHLARKQNGLPPFEGFPTSLADNETEAYRAADPAARAEFSKLAWGELARPR